VQSERSRAAATREGHAEPISASGPSAPAPQPLPAAPLADVAVAIPVARLIELAVGERNAPELGTPRSSFRVS
jgi:hypothetical protein